MSGSTMTQAELEKFVPSPLPFTGSLNKTNSSPHFFFFLSFFFLPIKSPHPFTD
jgi:hypothetical protein